MITLLTQLPSRIRDWLIQNGERINYYMNSCILIRIIKWFEESIYIILSLKSFFLVSAGHPVVES